MSAFQTRRHIVIGLCSAPLLPLPAFAQLTTPKAGSDYLVLGRPQPVESGDKIEVLEFFQYSCPHCFAFTPYLMAWRKRLAADVEYRRVPIAFDPSVQPHVQLYYALDALNRLDDLHEKVFNAIHVNHRRLEDTDEITEFVAANGIDRAQWKAAFNSFSVVTKTMQSGKVSAGYEITGTPTLACDGKYETAPSMIQVDSSVDRSHAGDVARSGALTVMDYLIDRSRKERGTGHNAKKK